MGGTTIFNASGLASHEEYTTAQCGQPYQGNLCGQCKPGYGKARSFVCRRCMSQAAIVAVYAAAVVGMIGLTKLLVFSSTLSSSTSRPDLKQPLPVELLRILVLHGQWLFIMSNMVGMPWPASMVYPFQVIGGIWSSTSGSNIGFECILSTNSTIPVAIQKLLICLLTPFGILCVVLLSEVLMKHCASRASGGWANRLFGSSQMPDRRATLSVVRHELASLIITIVFLFLPVWVGTAFSLFACVRLDDPASWPYQARAVGSYWVEDMSQQCFSSSGYHKGWVF